jgi:small subunit ribosomal protein S15
MSITKEKKAEVIKANRRSERDTGSSFVQAAILTERINALTGHFKEHRKDNLGKTGLARLVSTRKKLLAYLKRTDPKGYEDTIKKLGLRK